MTSEELMAALAPFKLLANKHALSATYSSLEIRPDRIVGCADSIILEAQISIAPKIKEPFFVNASTLLGVANALPEGKQEVVFEKHDTTLAWKCGNASGKFGLVALDTMPGLPSMKWPKDAVKPGGDLLRALALGSIACDASSGRSLGLNGIVLDTRNGKFVVQSTDDITISSATFTSDLPDDTPDVLTLSPNAVEILRSVMRTEGAIDINEKGWRYKDKRYELLIKAAPPLKIDLAEPVNEFVNCEDVAELDTARVKAFVRRVDALTEDKRSPSVSIRVEKGRMALVFNEGVSQTEEYDLATGLAAPDMSEVSIDGKKIARALGHVTEIGLDHIETNTVVLRNQKFGFHYIIAGIVT